MTFSKSRDLLFRICLIGTLVMIHLPAISQSAAKESSDDVSQSSLLDLAAEGQPLARYLHDRGLSLEDMRQEEHDTYDCLRNNGDLLLIDYREDAGIAPDLGDSGGKYAIKWLDPDMEEVVTGTVLEIDAGQDADFGEPPYRADRGWILIIEKGRGIPAIFDLDIAPVDCWSANLIAELWDNAQILEIEIQYSLDGTNFDTWSSVAPTAVFGLQRNVWKVKVFDYWQAYRIVAHWQNGTITSNVVGYRFPCSPAEAEVGKADIPEPRRPADN